jgi:UDP-N-acetylmuramate: L-alanyl-gamma-D-glutamyl-meso-diaminopimelate ligase
MVFLDFAHAPSKVKATVTALKEQYTERKLIACLELHTFSSLNEQFLDHYKNTMSSADIGIVYFNPETLRNKQLPEISISLVKSAFGNDNVNVFNDTTELIKFLKSTDYQNTNLLFMSSGNFGGIDMVKLAKELI